MPADIDRGEPDGDIDLGALDVERREKGTGDRQGLHVVICRLGRRVEPSGLIVGQPGVGQRLVLQGAMGVMVSENGHLLFEAMAIEGLDGLGDGAVLLLSP